MSKFIEFEKELFGYKNRVLLNSDHIYSVEENSDKSCEIITDRATFHIDKSFDELKQMISEKSILKFTDGKLTEVIPL